MTASRGGSALIPRMRRRCRFVRETAIRASSGLNSSSRPAGGIRFERISPGGTQDGAVLRHDSTPTEFNGALLSWTGVRWEMRLRDGSHLSFRDCEKDKEVCSLVERRDQDGHRIEGRYAIVPGRS